MRRVLVLAASMAALSVTTNALADDAVVEQPPVVELPATTPEAPTPEPAEPAPETPAVTTVEAPPLTPPVAEEPPPPPFVEPVPPPPAFAAPTLTIAQPKVADQPANAPTEKTERHDDFRIGALAGVGFPRPFAGEIFVKVKDYVGIGAEYSFLPTSTIAGADVRFHGFSGDLRLFPFQNGFFIGARAGKQWLSASTTVSAGPLGNMHESMAANTWFINPRIGYLRTWESGITVGVDAGVQIPVSPSYDRDSDSAKAGIHTSEDKTLVSVADVLGNKLTPTVDFLRVGFLF